MTHVNNHGGSCCGIRHITSFGMINSENDRTIENFFAEGILPAGRLAEAVLTDNQLRMHPHLIQILARNNFVLVSRFLNANSENICNVFHRHDELLALDDLPFNWTGTVAQPVEAPEPDVLFPVGSTVVIHNRGTSRYGLSGTVVGVRAGYRTVQFNDDQRFTYACTSLRAVTRMPAAVAPEPAPEPHVMMYRAAYTNGTRGGWYDSLDEVLRRAPRLRQYQTMVVRSRTISEPLNVREAI